MSDTGTQSDVVIIGYGPTGQTLALLLARKGHSVTVVERWPDLYPLPRAVHFDHEVARILQAAGAVDDINRITEDIDGSVWRYARRVLLLSLDWTGQGVSGWPISKMFSQPEFERVLDRHVKATDGIEVLQGWAAEALEQDSGGVRVTARRGTIENGKWVATDETRSVEGRYVVGADGANSFVRESLGVAVNDLGFAFDWLVVDVIPNVEREWNPKTWQLCDPVRPTTVVPGGPGRRRWEFMLLPGEEVTDMNREEKAWSLLAAWDMTPETATLERHAVYTFKALWAESWREGRVMLAGDAAHLMPPFAGQGMCSGLRDANALAWRLDLLLRNKVSDAILDSYGPERTGHVREMIGFSIELGKVICITDEAAAAGRDSEMIEAQKAPDYQSPPPLLPPLGPGLHVEGDPGAGQLGPQARVETGGRTGLFDDIFGNTFVLFVRSGRDLERLTPDNAAFLETIGAVAVELDGIGDPDGVYGGWMDSLESAAVLVRPDFYIFGSAKRADDVDALVDRLRTAINPPGTEGAAEPTGEPMALGSVQGGR